jgi:hypothetical protein
MLLIGAPADAAKCKLEDESVNQFTRESSKSLKWKSLTSTMSNMFGKAPEGAHEVKAAAVSARFEGQNTYLAIRINLEESMYQEPPPYELENAISIPDGSQLLILMDDGAILRLPVEKAVSFDSTFTAPGVGSSTGFRKTSTQQYVKSTEAIVNYVLDESTTAALKAQDATNMRVEAGDTYYDIDIHKKSTGDVAETLECLQQSRGSEGAAE